MQTWWWEVDNSGENQFLFKWKTAPLKVLVHGGGGGDDVARGDRTMLLMVVVVVHAKS